MPLGSRRPCSTPAWSWPHAVLVVHGVDFVAFGYPKTQNAAVYLKLSDTGVSKSLGHVNLGNVQRNHMVSLSLP